MEERAHFGVGPVSEQWCAFWDHPAYPTAAHMLPSKKHLPLGPICSPNAVTQDKACDHKGYKHCLHAAFNPLRIDRDRNSRDNSDRCGVHNPSSHI
jgi:hypothetical protein